MKSTASVKRVPCDFGNPFGNGIIAPSPWRKCNQLRSILAEQDAPVSTVIRTGTARGDFHEIAAVSEGGLAGPGDKGHAELPGVGVDRHANPLHLEVAVREALLADPDPDAVLRYVEAVPYDTDVLETAIAALDGGSCSALPLLRARLANAYAS